MSPSIVRLVLIGLLSVSAPSQISAQHRNPNVWESASVQAPLPAEAIGWRASTSDGADDLLESPESTRGERFRRTVGPAAVGSLAGLVAGIYVAGHSLGAWEADYGMAIGGLFAGAWIGSSLLSGTAAYYLGTPADGASFGRTFGGALLGAAPGVAAAILAEQLGGHALVGAAGYAVSQGAITALVSSW